MKASGLPTTTTPHSLRHYYASELVSRGVSVYAVAELLGHETPTLMLNTYGHLMPGFEDVARKTLEAAYMELRTTDEPLDDRSPGQDRVPTH